MTTRPLTKALGFVSVLVLVIVIVSDWPTGWLSNFWAEHAMLTNMVSSLVFLLLGATLVERWLARQEERKYQVVEYSAFSGVARAPLAARRALWFLINGGLVEDEEVFTVAEDEKEAVLIVLARYDFEVVKEREVGALKRKVPSDIDRLSVLLLDAEWVRLAHPIIRRTLASSRMTMARWAQLLMTSKRSSRLLRELAAVMGDIGEIRALMSPIYHGDFTPDEAYVMKIVVAWRKAFVNTCVVFEDFLLTVESPGFRRWSLDLVQPEDRDVIVALGIEKEKRTSHSGRVYGADALPSVHSASDVETLPSA